MIRRVLPSSFRSLRALEVLNIVGVGFALASCVAALFKGVGHDVTTSLASAMPTLGIAMLWAWLLRWQRTVWKQNIRIGWLLSVPLAAMNASLTCAVTFWKLFHHDLAGVMFAGATIGAVVWIPALLLTLLFFGLPLRWAQRRAKQGLAGQERGEWIVGLACLTISAVVLLSSLARGHATRIDLLGGIGALAGGTAAGLAFARERRRRHFVTAAAAGELPGYRVEPTAKGKVLLRVAETKSYRVADFEEDLYELDEEGAAKAPARATSL